MISLMSRSRATNAGKVGGNPLDPGSVVDHDSTSAQHLTKDGKEELLDRITASLSLLVGRDRLTRRESKNNDRLGSTESCKGGEKMLTVVENSPCSQPLTLPGE